MPQTWNLYNFSINGFVYIFIAYLFIFYITHVLVVYLGISLFKPQVLNGKTLSLLYNIHLIHKYNC